METSTFREKLHALIDYSSDEKLIEVIVSPNDFKNKTLHLIVLNAEIIKNVHL